MTEMIRAGWCCHLHNPDGCCDPLDCGPCCENCPTCPRTRPGAERALPDAPPGRPPRAVDDRPPEQVRGGNQHTGPRARRGRRRAGPPEPGAHGDTPAGGAPDPRRVWTLELPRLALLNANDRPHWARRASITRHLRQTVHLLALDARVAALARARVDVVHHPPTRRRPDTENLAPSVKACVDGLVSAGVLDDDSPGHIEGPWLWPGHLERAAGMRPGLRPDRGRLTIIVTELQEVTE